MERFLLPKKPWLSVASQKELIEWLKLLFLKNEWMKKLLQSMKIGFLELAVPKTGINSRNFGNFSFVG